MGGLWWGACGGGGLWWWGARSGVPWWGAVVGGRGGGGLWWWGAVPDKEEASGGGPAISQTINFSLCEGSKTPALGGSNSKVRPHTLSLSVGQSVAGIGDDGPFAYKQKYARNVIK